jgi:hypothetical protein
MRRSVGRGIGPSGGMRSSASGCIARSGGSTRSRSTIAEPGDRRRRASPFPATSAEIACDGRGGQHRRGDGRSEKGTRVSRRLCGPRRGPEGAEANVLAGPRAAPCRGFRGPYSGRSTCGLRAARERGKGRGEPAFRRHKGPGGSFGGVRLKHEGQKALEAGVVSESWV